MPRCGSVVTGCIVTALHRCVVALPHSHTATQLHSHTVTQLHCDSVTYQEVFDPRRSLVLWLTPLPHNLDVVEPAMCWYCRTSRGPWEDERQVAVSSRGGRGPAPATPMTLAMTSSWRPQFLKWSPKRLAASGRDRHSSSCGPRAARHCSATLPHCHTATLLHRDSVTCREAFNPRRSLVPWLTTFRSTWTSSSQRCAGRGYNTTWEISPRGPSHFMTEGNRVQPSC